MLELRQCLMQVGNSKPIVFQAPRRRLDHLSCGIKQQEVASMIQQLLPGLQRCDVMENTAIAKLPEFVEKNGMALFSLSP